MGLNEVLLSFVGCIGFCRVFWGDIGIYRAL